MNANVKEKLATIPEQPGSYQMLDESGHIIYVGKAKNLRARVKSYFVGSHDQKTEALVMNIADFTYLVTATELEAFLLELSLIKEHAPKYNIMLMDDKSYPYIEITGETYPRVIITRRPSKKARALYGPFPDASSARETIQILDRVFPLRKCTTMPKKLCLYYHMGQCLGPCELEVTEEETEAIIQKIRRFMTGHSKELLVELRDKMNAHAEKLEFEKAQEYRDIIHSLEKTLEKQQVIFADMKDRDILSYYAYDDYMAVTTLFMRQGKITFSESQLHPLQGMVEEAFLSYLGQYYQNKPLPQEILLPEGIEVGFLEEWLGKKIIIPKKGAKKALITMATENAQIHLQNNLEKFLKKHDKTIGATEELGRLLGIEAPRRIDTFDNSNTMGKNPVSAMVVFINGLPSKKDYRKYIVKTVEGADDYHTMQEVLYRRYQRMLMEQSDRPDLIVMDGGIHQVNAAKEILNSLYLDIPIIGLKKDDKHRTDSIVTSDHREFELDKHSNLFFLLSKIQEEVHRFAITFHRSKQSKDLFASMLDAVPGIGKQTRQRLLMRFKTLEGIKNASFEEWKEAGLNKNQIEALSIAFQKSNG